MAGEKIAEGEIGNAFAFIGAGGHHSGRDFFGGYCCFNDVALCVVNLREKHGFRRFAILDTDAHHGDGTRELFLDDPDILHVCFCGREYESPDKTKVDVGYPDPRGSGVDRPMNDAYFDRVARHFPDRVRRFRPDLLFWYFGFDTHQGDYGDIGLTGPCYWDIALPDAGSRGGGLRREARGGPRRRLPDEAGDVPDPAGHRAAGGAVNGENGSPVLSRSHTSIPASRRQRRMIRVCLQSGGRKPSR